MEAVNNRSNSIGGARELLTTALEGGMKAVNSRTNGAGGGQEDC